MAEFGAVQEADDTVKGIVVKVKGNLEEKMKKTFQVFEAVSYRTQKDHEKHIVKVHVGDNKFVHMILCNCNRNKPELKGYQPDHTLEDELKTFPV